jgi:hypothetical protein
MLVTKENYGILFTYMKVRVTSSPLTSVPPDVLVDVESTDIGHLWLLQTHDLFKS